MNAIIENATVTMHFSIKLPEGEMVETSYVSGDPVTFSFGDGTLTPGIEKKMLGLGVGDKRTFEISPEEGFGLSDERNIHKLPRQDFPKDCEVELGRAIVFEQPNGQSILGVVVAEEDDDVVIDFNHPLADKALVFDVEILAIAPQEVADEKL